jgi:hypothetical protein
MRRKLTIFFFAACNLLSSHASFFSCPETATASISSSGRNGTATNVTTSEDKVLRISILLPSATESAIDDPHSLVFYNTLEKGSLVCPVREQSLLVYFQGAFAQPTFLPDNFVAVGSFLCGNKPERCRKLTLSFVLTHICRQSNFFSVKMK